MLEPSLSVESRMLRTRKVTLLPLNNSEVLDKYQVDMVCERTSERAAVRAKICNSLDVRGKRGRDGITIIILFYLMHITCATIIASRGLESTAECWTV